jgi:hypothetical protein
MVEILYSARDAWRVFAVILFILGATCSAPAQASPNWTVVNASNCWVGWNSYFLYTNSNGDEWFGMTNWNDPTIPGLWQEFEMLQVVEDACNYAAANYQTPNLQSYINEINAICSGIGDQFPNQWKNANINDTVPNDDLEWGAAAFTRAYNITGNTTWLSQATNAFNIVWNRAQVSNNAALYGLRQSQSGTNIDSPVNFGCVVAGDMLAVAVPAPGNFYTNCANIVYTFAAGHHQLYQTWGKVWDSITGHDDYSYNYGIALTAATLQGDYNTCTNMANYLATQFQGNSNYPTNGVWTDGVNTYNLLPYYGNTNVGNYKNNAGYNGVCFRGLGYAIQAGYLTSSQELWAEENVEAAFYHRNNTTQVMWGNLQAHTPASGLYSWDCSSAVAGILNIPNNNSLGIGATRSGNNMIITYVGTLLSSPGVAGPYAPVVGATSPYTVPITSTQQFYRVEYAQSQ